MKAFTHTPTYAVYAYSLSDAHQNMHTSPHMRTQTKSIHKRSLTVFLTLAVSHTHITQSVRKLASAKHIAPAPSGSASKRELGVLIAN